MNTPIPLPHPHCYALSGTRLFAGEYPFDLDPVAAVTKLRSYLDAGITHFIDLTDNHELVPYADALTEECRTRPQVVKHTRLPIPDMGVPSVARMREILDLIDASLERGETVYVHCWGGVGRTGTVIGCHLVRRGLSGDEALARVAELYGSMPEAKRLRHTGSPETEAQRAFVRGWSELDG